MAHIHGVYDTDTHFIVDPVKKELTVAEGYEKVKVIQHDHNSERFTFEMPRYIEGHDMSTCNKVEVHYLNVDSKTKEESKGLYPVDDLQISPEDENIVICSWLISGNATKYVGTLFFVLRLECNTEGTIDYALNTHIYEKIYVGEGLYNSEAIATEYADVLEKWKEELITLGGVTDEEVETAVNKYFSKNPIETGEGLTIEQINALDNLFKIATYTEDPTNTYNAFRKAFKIEDLGELLNISAIYTGGNVTVGTDLKDLVGVIVKAHYSNGLTSNIGEYTLDGEIVEGENIITVTYKGLTTTFTVIGVTEEIVYYTITRNLTNYTSSSDVTRVASGESHNETLTISSGFVDDGVTITMGGVDITNEVFGDGYILITEVNGDIVITALASELVPLELYNGNASVNNLYSDNGKTKMATKYESKYFATKQIAYRDTEVTVTLTNNTENDISVGTVYAVMIPSSIYGGECHYAVEAIKLTSALGVGKSVQFKAVVKPWYRVAVITDISLTCVISGDLGTMPEVTPYEIKRSEMNLVLYSGDETSTAGATKYYAKVARTVDAFEEEKTVRVMLTNNTDSDLTDANMNGATYYGYMKNNEPKLYFNKEYNKGLKVGAPLIFSVTAKIGYQIALYAKPEIDVVIFDAE